MAILHFTVPFKLPVKRNMSRFIEFSEIHIQKRLLVSKHDQVNNLVKQMSIILNYERYNSPPNQHLKKRFRKKKKPHATRFVTTK